MTRTIRLLLSGAVITCAVAFAGTTGAQTDLAPGRPDHHHDVAEPPTPASFDLETQLTPVKRAAVSLPIAGVLAAALAFRPRRRGTPRRTPAVIQTQIILALVGAVVMLVVGQSLARAFGIVGAAGLVRYRAKIEDPKDAGVMLSTLAIGLAAGVDQYLLAAFATLVLLGVLWAIESLEPEEQKVFLLKVKTSEGGALRPQIEAVLRQFGIGYELRASSNDSICYELKLAWGTRTDRVSNAILRLDRTNATAVEWEEKKKKNG